MPQFREKVTRGTLDFPFAHYIMRNEDSINTMVDLHWHTDVEILYIIDGEVTANVAEERHILKPGDIFFINPQEPHSITSHMLPVKYHAAVFSTSLFEFRENHYFEEKITTPIEKGNLKFPRLITKENSFYNEINHYIDRIFIKDTESKILIFSNLISLFSILMDNSLFTFTSNSVIDKHSEDIKICIQYMKDNYSEKILLSELADLVHMSSNYFCSYFKNYTGMSPITQLNNIRIKKASSLLLKSNDSIVSIAENCGFENVSFFIRKFKEIMGCTPSVYRKNNK